MIPERSINILFKETALSQDCPFTIDRFNIYIVERKKEEKEHPVMVL
jgi:hypothetical protein